MEAKSYRQPDSLKIPEGGYFEIYTPTTGRIISPSLKYKLQYAKMQLSADADVTFVDEFGNVSTFALSKGEHSFPVTEIRVCAVPVAIRHDGKRWESESNFSTPIYGNANATN